MEKNISSARSISFSTGAPKRSSFTLILYKPGILLASGVDDLIFHLTFKPHPKMVQEKSRPNNLVVYCYFY